MKCVVVDDEPFALDLITGYIEKTPFLELAEGFTNPFKALDYLQKNTIDLLFLDINMPELTGLQLVKSLANSPPVIFTTAYSEFAAESYEYNAIDYLLKPVKYERFLKAVGKINVTSSVPKQEKVGETVFIKSGTQIHQVLINSIQYIEASGNYMTVYCSSKKLLTLLSMNELLEMLPKHLFVRIHKSYIVSLSHIEIVERHRVLIEGTPIPIGVTYREVFLRRFDSRK